MTLWPRPCGYSKNGRNTQGLVSASRGSTQRTSAGNVLVAWGQNPGFVEYTAGGELAMDIQRGQILTIDHGIEPIVAYRVAKGAWVGKPTWGPNISCVTTASDSSKARKQKKNEDRKDANLRVLERRDRGGQVRAAVS